MTNALNVFVSVIRYIRGHFEHRQVITPLHNHRQNAHPLSLSVNRVGPGQGHHPDPDPGSPTLWPRATEVNKEVSGEKTSISQPRPHAAKSGVHPLVSTPGQLSDGGTVGSPNRACSTRASGGLCASFSGRLGRTGQFGMPPLSDGTWLVP